MLRFSEVAVRSGWTDLLSPVRPAGTARHSGPGGVAYAGGRAWFALVCAVSREDGRGLGGVARPPVRSAQERLRAAVSRRPHVRILHTGVTAGDRFRAAPVCAG